jgi:anthranilate synthase component 1
MKKVKLKIFSKKIRGDKLTPILLYEKYVKDETGFLFESKEHPKGRYSIIGRKPYKTIKHNLSDKTKNLKYLKRVQNMLEKFPVEKSENSFPFSGGAVGFFGYDISKTFEDIPDNNIDTIGIPDSELMFFREFILYDHFHSQVIIVVLGKESEEEKSLSKIEDIIYELSIENDESYKIEDKVKIKNFKEHTSKVEYINNVNKAKKYIKNGDIFQVVLSQRWSAETEAHPFLIYRNLRELNPSPYLFYINFPEYQIIGSSPEMLVELRNNKVTTCPIAGTIVRGENEMEDKINSEKLLNDPKEKAEHFMLVDLGRNDMGKIAEIGSVEILKLMEVQYYSHVMHLVSLIQGEVKENQNMFSVLSSFLPAGTLSGAPKIRAMEIIEELESEKRGLYGGAVGYFGFDGNMDTCIAIRMIIKKNEKLYFQAGAGIVYDSIPEKEFEETENKIMGMIKCCY